MPVLERSELEASPLADLHAIADQLGLDGFRRLRKAELIDAILGDTPASGDRKEEPREAEEAEEATPRPRRRRSRRGASASSEEGDAEAPEASEEEEIPSRPLADSEGERGGRRGRGRGTRGGSGERSSRAEPESSAGAEAEGGRVASGVVEVLGNGSAFLRVDPPEPSDEDVYISAAQVRRCELVTGDQVSGPARTPRRSERYSSLVRIDTINGASADAVSDGSRYEDLPVAWPSERLALDSKDPTLEAIEWLTPLGRGSRAVIVGAPHAGKTATLRSLLGRFAGPGGRAGDRRRAPCRRARGGRDRADRQSRRPQPTCGPQDPRGRPQPQGRRIADGHRDRLASVRRRDNRHRARRCSHLDGAPADPGPGRQRHAAS